MQMATITKTTINVAELDQMIERGDTFTSLDVRNQDEFERWIIEERNPFEVIHIPYFQFMENEEASIARVPKGKQVVVCARGGSSEYVANLLREKGYDAINLEGGMVAWGNYYRVRRVEEVKDVALYQISSTGGTPVRVFCLSETLKLLSYRHLTLKGGKQRWQPKLR